MPIRTKPANFTNIPGWARSGNRSRAASASRSGPSIWLELLSGQRQIDIRALSLKLLLTKLRDQAQQITDAEVRLLKAHELQRYFVRHAHLLGHELAQLKND